MMCCALLNSPEVSPGMPISATVLIPRILTQYTGGRAELCVRADTVGDALAALKRDYPALYQCVCDETDAVRRHINLFVNNDLVQHRGGGGTRLHRDDRISIFQAVSGG